MRLRLVSAILALLGALVLLVAGVLAGVSPADWQQTVGYVGYALLLLALAAAGYCLVEKAPVWLGIIVAVCVPLLAATVWQALAPLLDDLGGHGEAATWLLAAVLGLVLAAVQRRQDFAVRRDDDRQLR